MTKKICTKKHFVLFFVLFAGLNTVALAETSKEFTASGVTIEAVETNSNTAPETGSELQPPPPARGQLSGRVVDANGQPVAGVAIIVNGTSNGTATDGNGNFRLNNVAPNATLDVSFIGFRNQAVSVEGRNNIVITVTEDTEQLDEVVVIGYGSIKKNDLTGSVSSVTAETIATKGTSSVMGALQGSVAGADITTSSARPGAGFSIQIRGQNTLNPSGATPLYVVDGIITGDIDFLNPSDIERIDILKDASSTAIYGSRGSNGVVIVQTKGASAATSRLTISYDGYYGIRDLARIPDFMDGREWTDFRTSRYYTFSDGKYALSESNKTAIHQNSKWVMNSLYNQQYTDWLDLATQSGSQQNHYLAINGSGSGISYNLGMGYQQEEGNYLNEQMDRYTLKGSVNHKASNWFSAGASFNLSHQVVDQGSQLGYQDVMRMPVILRAYDENGELIGQPGIAASIEGAGNFTSSTNPLYEISSGSNINKRTDVMANFFIEITPMEGLSLKTNFAPRFQQRQNAYYRGRTPGRATDEAQTNHQTAMEWTWDNQITYQKSFGKHSINATAIASLYKTQSESLQVRANDFPYNSAWYNIFSGSLISGGLSSGYNQTQMASFSGRVNYDYAGKYLLTGTVRYDGSSKLGDGNQWAVFPSGAFAWRISEEEFLRNTRWLSNLKLRVSYGESGNNNISPFSTQQKPSTGSNVLYDFNGSLESGFAVGAPVNAALTWEKTREWNAGIDFGLFGGRISGSVDLYDKLSKGLLMSRTLTIESGVASMTDNIGSVNNRGIEVSLTSHNIRSRNFSWTTTFTFASNKNAIRELYGKKEDVVGETRFIGEPIGVIFDYQINGVYSQAEWNAMTPDQRTAMGAIQPGYAKAVNTNWLSLRNGEAGNDKMDTNDRMILGQTAPKWTGGVTSNMRWKNIDFSFNIYTRQGSMISDAFLAEYGVASSNQRGRPKVIQNYYIPEGAPRINWNQWDTSGSFPTVTWGTSTENYENAVPNQGYTGNFYGNNGRYQDNSFVKVRNITIGYTFPTHWVQKIRLSHARIYFNVLNPFVFTDYIGWDPEYATTSLTNGNGPSSVTYQFGVNLKF